MNSFAKSFRQSAEELSHSRMTRIFIRLGLVFSCFSLSVIADTSPPEIVSFDFTPKTVDVSNGPAEITFTARIRDTQSGFDNGNFYFRSPSDQQSLYAGFWEWERISGTAQDGIYETTVIIPQYSEVGIWEVEQVDVEDQVGNRGQWWPKAEAVAYMQSNGFPYQITIQNTNPDTSPPEIVSFDFTPKTVDVSNGPAEITFTARILDNLSGFDNGNFYFRSPSDQQSLYAGFWEWERISGTAQDGIYETTVIIPQYSEAGIWEVEQVDVEDQVGNRGQWWPKAEAVAYMQSNGFPYQITIQNTNPDTSPPEIVSFDFTPKTVDVSNGPAEITFTARILDNLSGFEDGNFYFKSPSFQQSLYAGFGEWVRISGTAQDGIYERTVIIPQFSEPGTWVVEQVYVRDQVGNRGQWWSKAEAVEYMQLNGFPHQITVVNNNREPFQPGVLALNFTPQSVNVSHGPAEITLSAHLREFRYAEFVFRSPTSGQDFWMDLRDVDRVSGTAQEGIYEITEILSEFSEPGIWEIESIYLSNTFGYQQSFYSSDAIAFMASSGFPYQLVVQNLNPDVTPPEVISFDFSPKVVDVSSGPAEITFTARIRDTQSGFYFAFFDFDSPSNNEYFWVEFDELNRVEGTSTDGVYQTTVTLPQGSEPGVWQNFHIWIEDHAGNFIELFPTDETLPYMQARGFPHELVVFSNDYNTSVQIPHFRSVTHVGDNLFQSETAGLLSLDQGVHEFRNVFSHSLQAHLFVDGQGINSTLFGRLTPNPWNIPHWVVSEFFGLVHFGADADQYAGWVSSERFGWMRFVDDGGGNRFLWVHRLQTWMAVNSDGSFHSFDFGWLVPEPGSFTRYNSRIGILIDDEHNPDGWLRSDRFGFVWFARDGTGVWFWSSNRNEWIGITADGGLWSSVEERFLF
jgi:elongation factor P hydroxylase